MFQAFEALLQEQPRRSDGRILVHPPATDAAIEAVAAELGQALPASFRAFLRRTNGATFRGKDRHDLIVDIPGTEGLKALHHGCTDFWDEDLKDPRVLLFAWVPGSGADYLGFLANEAGPESAVLDCHEVYWPAKWAQSKPIASTFAEWLQLFCEHRCKPYWLPRQ